MLLPFAALAATVAAASSQAQVLQARPHPTAATLRPGETLLAKGAVAYRPRSAAAGPLPLIILLHGASGYPQHFLQSLEPIADRRGAILLAPHSRGATWDFIKNVGERRDPWRGADLIRLDQALTDLFGRAQIDPNRVVLLGFSDGASYGLSLGLANPQLFSAIIALSPGFAVPPNRIDQAQRVFVAHGRNDSILPFENTDRSLIPSLREGGANLLFRPFAGDHQIDRRSLDEALDFALGLQASVPAPTSPSK